MVAALRPPACRRCVLSTIPAEGPVNEAAAQRAAAGARVSHAMVTRITNVTTQVNVSPGMVMGPAWGQAGAGAAGWVPAGGGFVGYQNAMWATMPPQVTTTQNVHADTRIFDASDAMVLWSAAHHRHRLQHRQPDDRPVRYG